MSGRRMKETIEHVLVENGFRKDAVMVIAGLSNTYADYVATYEEYQVHGVHVLYMYMYVGIHACEVQPL